MKKIAKSQSLLSVLRCVAFAAAVAIAVSVFGGFSFVRADAAADGYDRSQNLALGKTVTVSSDFSYEQYQMVKLNDGKRADGAWISGVNRHTVQNASAGAGNEWAKIDLGKNYTLDCVKLYPGVAMNKANYPAPYNKANHVNFAEDYEIQLSSDNAAWTTVYSKEGDTDNDEWAGYTGTEDELLDAHARVCTFAPTRARYVRFVAKKLAVAPWLHQGRPCYLCGLGEMEVYGNAGDAKIALEEMVSSNGERVESDYGAGWSEFAAALEKAETLLTQTGIEGSAYESMCDELEEAVSGLKVKNPYTKLDPVDNVHITAYRWLARSDKELEEQLELAQAADIDYISNICFEDDSMLDVAHYKQLAAKADEYGIGLLVRGDTLGMGQWLDFYMFNDDQIRELALQYKDAPGIAGFILKDEPPEDEANAHARPAKILHEVLPDKDIILNFNYSYATSTFDKVIDDYSRLIYDMGSYISFDVYCFSPQAGNFNESLFYDGYETLRVTGLEAHKNTAAYVQSIGSNYYGYRRPNGSEVRYNMNAAMAYGVKNIEFFCWSTPDGYTEAVIGKDGKPTDLYEPIAKINKKIHAYGQYVAKCDATQVYHAGAAVASCKPLPENVFLQPSDDGRSLISFFESRENDTDAYMMIVNKDFAQAQTLAYALNGVTSLTCYDDDGVASTLDVSDGTLTVTLAPGDCVLYKIPASAVPGKSTTVYKNRAFGASARMSSSVGNKTLVRYLTDGEKEGNLGFKFNGGEKSTQEWITLDLGLTKKFNRIDLYPMGGGRKCGALFPREYTISVSNDGENWSKVADVTTFFPLRTVPITKLSETQTARYVRFVFGGANCYRAEIAEIEIYNDDGTMPALIATAYSQGDSDSTRLSGMYERMSAAYTDEKAYSAQSWKLYQDALNTARELLDCPVVGQWELDEACVQLVAAEIGLKASARALSSNSNSNGESPSSGKKKCGSSVDGGTVALIAAVSALCLAAFCLRRRKRQNG